MVSPRRFIVVMVLSLGKSLAFLPENGPRLKGQEIGELPGDVVHQLPKHPPRWMMNQSTIIMPCNNSGYMDPARTAAWSIIDFDWSNGKAIWTKHRLWMSIVASFSYFT